MKTRGLRTTKGVTFLGVETGDVHHDGRAERRKVARKALGNRDGQRRSALTVVLRGRVKIGLRGRQTRTKFSTGSVGGGSGKRQQQMSGGEGNDITTTVHFIMTSDSGQVVHLESNKRKRYRSSVVVGVRGKRKI